MDFLGLSTLTLIDDAVHEIARTTGQQVDIDAIPMDDPKTYQLFSEGHTLGVFQFESSGMRETLRKARPQRFDDLIALNALYRPGPLKGGVVDDFIQRRHGRKAIEYELPQLEPILRDTYGVIAYQEQVMRIARDLGGFTMGEADLLRKAMGKKDPKVMQAQRAKFLEGARRNALPEKRAAKIFDLMEFFAGYGFNKSHSTTYAYLAYQTGWLKANYPRHFMAALLTIESQNTDKLAMYLGECRELGVPVLPPDVNRSELAFTVEPEGVRYGLGAVKGAGEGAVAAVLGVRRARGALDSLFTLCEDLDLRVVNKRVLESLVKAGACDGLGAGTPGWNARSPRGRRARLFASLDRAMEHGARIQKDREKGQSQLFASVHAEDEGPGSSIPLLDAEPWQEAQQLTHEKQALGLYLSGHPISRFTAELKAFGAKSTGEFTTSEAEMSMGGVISAVRLTKTKKGDRMAIVTLEDEGGAIDVVVYSEAFRACSSLLVEDAMVVVRGRLDKDEESARIVASEVLSLATVRERVAREVAVRIVVPPHGRPTFEALADVFAHHPGDRRLALELDLRGNGRSIRVRLDVPPLRVRASERLVADVERICGEGSVQLR
jgi:DNA polymerase-3 subunit alpha